MDILARDPARTRYEALAASLRRAIENGTYRKGRRLPSVRELKERHGVGTTTVLEALRLLEREGLVSARLRSGYVACAAAGAPPPPRPIAALQTRETQKNALIAAILTSSREPNVIPLGCAYPEPSFYPTHRLRLGMALLARRTPDIIARRSHTPGTPGLRREIARHMQQWGGELSPEEIIVTTGGRESLQLGLMLACKPGDSVLVESPCYFGLLQLIELLRLRVVEVPADPRDGIDVELVSKAIEKWPVRACVITSVASNPSGGTLPAAVKARLAATLRRRNVLLIEDYVYGDLAFAGSPPPCALALDPMLDAIICGSFNKTLAPGLRVGWVASKSHSQDLVRLKSRMSDASPLLIEQTIADFLESGRYARHLRALRAKLRENASRMVELVQRSFPAGTQIALPTGGYVSWVTLPRDVDAQQLYDRCYARRITTAPGTIFCSDQRFDNALRLNFGIRWTARLEGAVRTVGRLAQEMIERSTP